MDINIFTCRPAQDATEAAITALTVSTDYTLSAHFEDQTIWGKAGQSINDWRIDGTRTGRDTLPDSPTHNDNRSEWDAAILHYISEMAASDPNAGVLNGSWLNALLPGGTLPPGVPPLSEWSTTELNAALGQLATLSGDGLDPTTWNSQKGGVQSALQNSMTVVNALLGNETSTSDSELKADTSMGQADSTNQNGLLEMATSALGTLDSAASGIGAISA